MAHDVFISYASKDKATADAVCARLEARGIRCWIAPRDVQPGLPYGEEIIDAIHSSRVMVLVFSSNANASPHIPKEIERAVSYSIPVIPLRVEDVVPAKSLDYFISSVHWLDAITQPLEQHLESLANTILAVLRQKGIPKPEPGQRTPVAPTPPAPVTPSTAVSASKSKLKIPVIAGAVVVLAAIAWFVWGRGSASDALVGCWQWFNNVPVVIHSNGTMVAGPFTAQWRLVDSTRRVYNFTWPEAVDQLSLSYDGRMLSGGNQYGFSTAATRLAYGTGIVGPWRWPNGAIVQVKQDGTFNVGNITGHWRLSDAARRTYALTWPKPVDTVTLSPDSQRVSGGNQYGIPISGTRTAGSCGD